MSDIDLTEAVEAARDTIRAHLPNLFDCRCGESFGDRTTIREAAREYQTHQAQAAITAALPHIDRQVREQVAREIEAGVDLADHPYVRSGMREAARIARGDS